MEKILIIDDKKQELDDIKSAIMENNSKDIDNADSVEKAIELISKNNYDLIITDLILDEAKKNYDGFEVLKYAKKKNLLTQVIIVTGYGNTEVKAKAISLGAFDYIDKPTSRFLSSLLSKYKGEIQNDVNKALEFKKGLENEGA